MHALNSSTQSHKQMEVPGMTSPTALVINGLLCLPFPAPHSPLRKDPMSLTKTLLFWFDLTIPALAQESQSAAPVDSYKGNAPILAPLSIFCLDLPCVSGGMLRTYE